MALNQNSSNNPLPPIYRWDFGDYQGLGSVFQKFLANLNLFTLSVYNILNGGIGFQNLQRTPYTFQITGGSDNTFSFVNPLPIAPTGVVVCRVVQTNTIASPISNDISCSNWIYDGKYIQILHVTNLLNGVTYSITLEIF